MRPPKFLPLLKCDICGFSTKNHFIFKLHRNRCLRDHSAGSGAQPPGSQKVLKFGPGSSGHMECQDGETEEGGNLDDSSGENALGKVRASNQQLKPDNSDSTPAADSLDSLSPARQTRASSVPKAEMMTKLRPRKSETSETDLEDSSDTVQMSPRASRRFAGATEQQSVATEEEGGESEEETGIENLAVEFVEEQAGPSHEESVLPAPHVNRNYSCGLCGYATTKSKVFLYHQIEQHNARISVFPCNFCEYASRYKHKLARHITYTHKVEVPREELNPENLRLNKYDTGITKRFTAVARPPATQRNVGSTIAKTKSLSSLLGKLRSTGKVLDPRVSAFFTDLSSPKQDGGESGQLTDQFKCKLCLFTGKSRNQMVRHIYACHINGRVFRCNLCSFRTQSQIDFYAHKKKHSTKNATVHKCTECAYATDFKPNFDRHMSYHGSNKPHKCTLCNYAVDHEGALKRHITSQHPNTAHNTSLVAGEEASTTEDGEMEMDEGQGELASDGFRCPICSLIYRRCADLNRHMKSKHNVRRKDFFEDSAQDSPDIDEEDSLNLPDEFVEFDDAEAVEFDDNDRDDFVDVENDDEDEESLPLADLIPKEKSHPVSKQSLKCSYCSYIAKWPSDLRRHLLVHSVEKRFKCSLCWKKYKYLGDLNVHLRRDHEVDPESGDVICEKVNTIPLKKNPPSLFRCPACPFACKFKAEMEGHRRIHNEQKSYLCKLCDYQTYWRGDMGRHLYKRHTDKVMKDADINDYFEFRPENRALTKTKSGRETRSKTPEIEESVEMEATRGASVERETTVTSVSLSSRPNVSVPFSPSSPEQDYEETHDKYGVKSWRCRHCPYTANQTSKMREHLNTHYNLKQFKCPICGQRANWKYDIRKHMAVKHPGVQGDVIVLSFQEAEATIEEYMRTMPNVRREHHFNVGDLPLSDKQSQRVYGCSECPFTSDYRWNVNKHQKSAHGNLADTGQLTILVMRKGAHDDDDSSRQSGASHRARSATPDINLVKKENTQDVSPEKRERRQAALAAEKKTREPEAGDDPGGDLEEGGEDQYRCAACGKSGATKGDIKKHYNYIHRSSDIHIINVKDGSVFDYYTGLPVEHSEQQSTSVTLTAPPDEEKDGSPINPNDPKTHGYVKPFQCSVCGHRSNWKWDVKKHLRIKHPGLPGFVIMLQIDQARATCPGRQNSSATSSTPSDASLKYSRNKDEASKSPSADDFSQHSTDISPGLLNRSLNEIKLGRLRRYKCSKCGYRSNWRTDIIRHIERKHNNTNARLIFMDPETARNTLMDYERTRGPPFTGKSPTSPTGKSHPLMSTPSTQMKLTLGVVPDSALQGRVWNCPKCSFSSSLKSHILQHMQGHNMKPFHCSECEFTSRFRSPLYRHIRNQHNSTDYTKFAKIVIKFYKQNSRAVAATAEDVEAKYVDAYLCRMCNTMESESQEELIKHLAEVHTSSDANQALRVRKRVDIPSRSPAKGEGAGGPVKKYFCTICPYRTDKRSMLTFHHTYHQQTAQNRVKCKYCPYYVCHNRLLHQHMRWHDEYMQGPGQDRDLAQWKKGGEKTPPLSPSKRSKVVMDATPKRYNCEKCPYTSNSKNDFIYHKQFHRPKPAAEYKCDQCDYWVTQRRLLKQHMRVHGEFSDDEPRAGLSAPDTMASPSKSMASDASAVMDAVEIAAIKQKMITTKITASLSTSPAVSPMKIATQCSAGNRPGFILQNGLYRKLYQCRKCPYTNLRPRNLRLHELMHGPRKSDHPLMKCPHCDYYVGAKGLLSHHMKVHLQHYLPDPGESTTFDLERKEGVVGSQSILAVPDEDDTRDVFASPDIPQKHKVDTLLEIARFKKYSCEKCPYASGKRAHFTRHMELHGSRQRHTCEYCDYSVPNGALLTQHRRIHMMPNQNLLATQSFSNLQHMNEVPADVALASALPPTDSAEPVTISVIHDHLELYENDDTNSFDLEPKKLYRCDRCPYANVKRDHLLTHLRFHMQRSTFHCPYCDYSVPKQQLLTQHIRVHFCPLPELSDWLIENGQTERAQEVNDIDLTRALEVAEKYQTSSKRKANHLQAGAAEENVKDSPSKKVKTGTKDAGGDSDGSGIKDSGEGTSGEGPATEKKTAEEEVENDAYICQYCDREFATSKQLISHEMQHLIGNHFEISTYLTLVNPSSAESFCGPCCKHGPQELAALKEFSDDGDLQNGSATEKLKIEENSQPVMEASQTNDNTVKDSETVDSNPLDAEQPMEIEEAKDRDDVSLDEQNKCKENKSVLSGKPEASELGGKTDNAAGDSKNSNNQKENERNEGNSKEEGCTYEQLDAEESMQTRRQLRPRGEEKKENGGAKSEESDQQKDSNTMYLEGNQQKDSAGMKTVEGDAQKDNAGTKTVDGDLHKKDSVNSKNADDQKEQGEDSQTSNSRQLRPRKEEDEKSNDRTEVEEQQHDEEEEEVQTFRRQLRPRPDASSSSNSASNDGMTGTVDSSN